MSTFIVLQTSVLSFFLNGRPKLTKDQEQSEAPRDDYRRRSRSPPRRGGYTPIDDYHRSRGPPPRGAYDPRDDYRRRSPPRRDDYWGRDSRYRSPPRTARGPPIDDGYPPVRGGYREDPYVNPPPHRRDDPYADYRQPRPRSPPRAYPEDYAPRPRYW